MRYRFEAWLIAVAFLGLSLVFGVFWLGRAGADGSSDSSGSRRQAGRAREVALSGGNAPGTGRIASSTEAPDSGSIAVEAPTSDAAPTLADCLRLPDAAAREACVVSTLAAFSSSGEVAVEIAAALCRADNLGTRHAELLRYGVDHPLVVNSLAFLGAVYGHCGGATMKQFILGFMSRVASEHGPRYLQMREHLTREAILQNSAEDLTFRLVAEVVMANGDPDLEAVLGDVSLGRFEANGNQIHSAAMGLLSTMPDPSERSTSLRHLLSLGEYEKGDEFLGAALAAVALDGKFASGVDSAEWVGIVVDLCAHPILGPSACQQILSQSSIHYAPEGIDPMTWQQIFSNAQAQRPK